MKALIIPLLLALLGIGAGAGAGLFLRPEAPAAVAAPCGEPDEALADDGGSGGAESTGPDEAPDDSREYVKLNNQFIVPIVEKGRVASMVVLGLSLEVDAGQRETVFAREPKLRDSFLQVLFDHANSGGFSENFTTGTKMNRLSKALEEVGRKVLGDMLSDVLIIDIVRQDG